MAYVPDKLGERRRAENVSQTAFELFIKYCEYADRETGLTFANAKTCAEAFQMRIDNAQKYDKELQDKGWIRLVEYDARICRKVEAGWQPKSQRQGKAENTEQGKAENTELLRFRNELENLLNFRKSSYILGEIPKFKEKILNFRNAYKEYIDQHINQQLDQLLDHLEKAAQDAPQPSKPKVVDKPAKLSPDFAVTEDLREWAAEHAPNVNVEKATKEFIGFWCDIATKNHRRTQRGWRQTWRNRMTELQERFEARNGKINPSQNGKRTNGGQPGNQRTDEETLSWLGIQT